MPLKLFVGIGLAMLAMLAGVMLSASSERKVAVIRAALEGQLGEVERLLNEGADVDVKADSGSTALMVASHNGNVEMVRLLLKNGADVNAKCNKGVTALMDAASNGNAGVVKLIAQPPVAGQSRLNIVTRRARATLRAARSRRRRQEYWRSAGRRWA